MNIVYHLCIRFHCNNLMFSGWFNKNKRESNKNSINTRELMFAFLGADLHSHFIPGIDDGAATIEDSLLLLRAMADMGYNTIITTPHIMIDFYPNTPEKILNGLDKLQVAVKENGINISLRAAAEYFLDERFVESLEKKEKLLTIRDNEVLIEFSTFSEPQRFKEVIFKMMTGGYRPIIAHPERYLYFNNNLENFVDLKDRGCLLQMNLLSISGYYGAAVKKTTELLLEEKLYDFCGSDVHHERHINAMKALIQTKNYDKLANYPFLNKKLCF